MATTLINYFVDKYLSEFVEIDKDKTKTSLLSGIVEMENLSIKDSLFKNANIPYIEIKHGFIGKIKVSFSPFTFWKNPIKIQLSKIFVLLRQKNIGDLNEQEEIKKLEDFKAKKLLALEELKNQISDIKTEPGMVEQIINNLVIEIEDIVVRFEDDISYPLYPYAICLSLSKIFVKSTNMYYDESIEKVEVEEINYKILKIEGISIYLDYSNKTFEDIAINNCKFQIDESMRKFFKDNINLLNFYSYCKAQTIEIPQNNFLHNYLLWNFSCKVKLSINDKPENNFIEKINLIIEIQNLITSFSFKQITILLKLVSYLSLNNYYIVGISKKYYVQTMNKEYSESYVSIYSEYYNAKYNKKAINLKLAEDKLKTLNEMGSGISFNQLSSLREIAYEKYILAESIKNIETQESSYNNRWGVTSYFTGNNDKEALKELANQKELIKQKEEANKQKIGEALNKNNTAEEEKNIYIDFPREFKALIFTFNISVINMSISKDTDFLMLNDNTNKKLLEINLINLSTYISIGGRIQFTAIELSLQELSIKQFIIEHNNSIILETESLTENNKVKIEQMSKKVKDLNIAQDCDINLNLLNQNQSTENNNLFNMEILINDQDPVSNLRVKIRNNKQIAINLNICSMLLLKDKLLDSLTSEVNIDDLQLYASSEAINMLKKGKSLTSDILTKTKDNRFSILIDAILFAPRINLIQEERKKYNQISASIGVIQIFSNIIDKKRTSENTCLYDTYYLKLEGLSLSTNNEYLINPINLDINIDSIVDNIYGIKQESYDNIQIYDKNEKINTKTRVEVLISQINFETNLKKLKVLIDIMNSQLFQLWIYDFMKKQEKAEDQKKPKIQLESNQHEEDLALQAVDQTAMINKSSEVLDLTILLSVSIPEINFIIKEDNEIICELSISNINFINFTSQSLAKTHISIDNINLDKLLQIENKAIVINITQSNNQTMNSIILSNIKSFPNMNFIKKLLDFFSKVIQYYNKNCSEYLCLKFSSQEKYFQNVLNHNIGHIDINSFTGKLNEISLNLPQNINNNEIESICAEEINKELESEVNEKLFSKVALKFAKRKNNKNEETYKDKLLRKQSKLKNKINKSKIVEAY